MPKPLKIISVIVGILLVLIIAAIGTLYVMFPPAKLKAMALPQVEKFLGRKTDVGSIGITVFPVIGVKIKDLTIANTARAGFGSGPFVGLDEFVVGVKVLPLLKKELQISKIVIKRPQILVETDESGAFNFDDLGPMVKDPAQKEVPQKTGLPQLPIPLTLEKFTIENGTLIFDDRKSKTKLVLGTINETVAFSIDKELKKVSSNGKLVIGDLSYASKEIKKPLSGITITLTHDILVNVVDGLLTIKDVRASLQKIYVSVNGTVANFNASPVLDLNVKTDKIDLADLIAEIPPSIYADIAKVKATGTAEVALTVRGELPKTGLPQIDGRALLNNIVVQYAGLPKAINSVNGDIGFTANSLNITALDLKLGENPLSVKGTVNNFAKPVIDLALLADINLGDLKDIVPLPAGNTVSGGLKADIRAKGEVDPANPAKLDLGGKLELANVTTTTPALTKPVVFNGNVGFSSRVISPNVQVAIGGSTLLFKADLADYLSLVIPDSTKRFPRPSLAFTLHSPSLNTDEFMPPPPEEGKAPVLETGTPAVPSLLLPAPLPGVDVRGTITSNRLVYQKIELTNTSMTLNSVNDVMESVVKTGVLGGTMSHALNVDLRSNTNLKAHSRLSIDNVEVKSLIGSFKHMLPKNVPMAVQIQALDNYLSGKIRLKSDLISNGGTAEALTKNLVGTIDMKLANGVIKKGPLIEKLAGPIDKFYKVNDIVFDDMTITARVKDERLFFDDTVRIQSKSAGDWGFSGNAGFDASLGLDVSNRLSAKISAELLGLQGKGKSAIKDLLGGTQLAGLSGLVDNAGIPADNEKRVTLLLGVGGTVMKPTASFKGFGRGTGSAQSAAPTPKQQLQQVVDQKKKELEDAARAKIEAEKEALAKKVSQDIKKAVPQLDQKKAGEAVNKLKKLF